MEGVNIKSSKPKKSTKGGFINGRPIGNIGRVKLSKKKVTFAPATTSKDAERTEAVEILSARMSTLNMMAESIVSDKQVGIMESWLKFQNRDSKRECLASVTKNEFEILQRLVEEAKSMASSTADESSDAAIEEISSGNEDSETEDGEIKVYTQKRPKKSRKRRTSPIEELPSDTEMPKLTPIMVSPVPQTTGIASTSIATRMEALVPQPKRAKIVAHDSAPSSPLLMSKNPERAQVKRTLRKSQNKLQGNKIF